MGWRVFRKFREQVFGSGSKLIIAQGGELDVESGGALKLAGQQVTASAAVLNALTSNGVDGIGSGYKLARGVHETASASDTIDTGLATVVAAVAVLEGAPSLDTLLVQAVVGNQAGSPAAGRILIKSWKVTAANDVTPIAATTFGVKVSWIAIGT